MKVSEGRRCGKKKKSWWGGWMKRRFTGQTPTSHSQLDGVVINYRSLRVWTPPGTHFKRGLKFCLLASDLPRRTGRLWSSCRCAGASTSGWQQHLVWNWDFVSPESFPVTSLWTLAVRHHRGTQRVQGRISHSKTRPPPPLELQWWSTLNAKHLDCLPIPRSGLKALLSGTLRMSSVSILRETWAAEEGTCTPCLHYYNGGLLCCPPINESISPTLIY